MSIVERKILNPGKGDLGKLVPETKLVYHFQTVIRDVKNQETIVLDDSRQMAKGQPVETIYGKQFKLPIWENCLASMRKGEICRLTVRDDPVTHYICLDYIVTSKCFRKYYGVKPTVDKYNSEHDHKSSHHQCSMSLRDSPYKDLNELVVKPPETFEFTFELVDAISPESYIKDVWQMSDEEKLSMVTKFREIGNKDYAESNYEKAEGSYVKGLSVIESLMLKEQPHGSEWKRLDAMKKLFLSNLAQVKLIQGDYYGCIRNADEVLKRDPDDIKALFRRAKANAAVWNLDDARNDLNKCRDREGNMSVDVAKCFQDLNVRETIKNKEDRERYKKMLGQQ